MGKTTKAEGQGFAAAVEVAEGEGRTPDDGLIRLSSGVVLRVRPTPRLALRQAFLRVKKPVVPTVFIEEKDRNEENPNDPDYIEALDEYATAITFAVSNVLLVLGTEIESVPEGMFRPEDAGFQELMQTLDFEIDTNKPSARYLAWLQFYALVTDEDIAFTIAKARTMAGLTDEEVSASAESFRNRKERRTNKRRRASAKH